ncbi:diguanylate cyclase [Aquipuribacter nitratireducens]|uniref:GGDEF domain-containing protein n=1 Tax=Aquipuribacter nitratireducens TaxID=650104 RepID=A0ABW0GQ93_9MICO
MSGPSRRPWSWWPWAGSPDPVMRVLLVLVLVLWPTTFAWLLPGQHRPGVGLALAVACAGAFSVGAVLLLVGGARPDRHLPGALAAFTVAAVAGALAGSQPEMALVVPLFLSALCVVAAVRLSRRQVVRQVALSSAAAVVCVAYVAATPVQVVASVVAVVAGVAAPATAVTRLRWQLDAARAREHRLARTDALTGALNRRGLFEAAADLCALQVPLVVVVLDLDGFKLLNDTHGHAVGDDVLVAVTRALGGIGDGDVCGQPVLVTRLGGEEFLVLAPSTGVPTALVADRARAAAAVDVADGERASASVGAVCGTPPVAPDEQRAWLLRTIDEADRLMYAAKRSGGDRTRVG